MPAPQIRNEMFLANAEPIEIDVGGTKMVALPRTFLSGSVGFYCGQKVTIMVGGKPIILQVGVTLTVVGSKPTATPA